MTERKYGIDCIYLAACSRDARLTRICLASIRYFYPDVPIKILAGDILQPGLADEVKKYWNVDVHDLPEGDYGWGLVKLEPLFGRPGEKFLVMDVDTVMTGRFLDHAIGNDAPFIVDNEELSDADFKRLYYDWDKLAEVDSKVRSARTAFNVGQWFGTAGLVRRDELDRWVEWSLPRRLRFPDVFMGGDQGVMNYVVLQKEAYDGLRIDRRTLMRWPGHSLDGLDAASVAAGRAPPLVIHWAGMKKFFLSNMAGADLLTFFEKFYYTRVPLGPLQRALDIGYHLWLQVKHYVGVRAKLTWRKWTAKPGLLRAPAQP